MIKSGLMCCSALIFAGMLTSCLKEDECPPHSNSVLVAVQDTDYDNADEITLPISVAGNQPFSTYVVSLDVVGKSVSTPGKGFHQSVTPGSSDRMITLDTRAIQAGRYEITVSGNTAAENLPSGSDYLLELHPTGTESGDIYLERDTVDLPPAQDHTIYLHRAKGKLILLYTDFPDNIASIGLKASGLYKNVDGNMSYSGITEASKTYQLPDRTGSGQMEFLLSPTIPSASAELQATLYDQNGDAVRSFSGIVLNMLRNHITVLDIRYIPAEDTWEIWVYATGEWIQLHNLDIE